MVPERWTRKEEQMLFEYVKAHLTEQNHVCWKQATLLFRNRTLAQITSKFNRMKREDCNMWDIEPRQPYTMVIRDQRACSVGNRRVEDFEAPSPLKFEIDVNKNYSDVPGSVVKAWSELL